MPNSNPQAILVANEKIRVAADRVGQLYGVLALMEAEFTAEGWGTLFPNGSSEVLVDGSATDGRTPITDADVRTFMLTVAAGFLATLRANSNAQLNNVLKIAVHPEP